MEAKVVIYTKDGCSRCHFLMNYMRGIGLEFTEINISNNKSGLDFLKTAGIQGLPYTIVYDKYGRIIDEFSGADVKKATALKKRLEEDDD